MEIFNLFSHLLCPLLEPLLLERPDLSFDEWMQLYKNVRR